MSNKRNTSDASAVADEDESMRPYNKTAIEVAAEVLRKQGAQFSSEKVLQLLAYTQRLEREIPSAKADEGKACADCDTMDCCGRRMTQPEPAPPALTREMREEVVEMFVRFGTTYLYTNTEQVRAALSDGGAK